MQKQWKVFIFHSFIAIWPVEMSLWCSTSMKKTIKNLFNKQKQAIKIIPKADILGNLDYNEKMKLQIDIPNILFRVTKFAISSRGPRI